MFTLRNCIWNFFLASVPQNFSLLHSFRNWKHWWRSLSGSWSRYSDMNLELVESSCIKYRRINLFRFQNEHKMEVNVTKRYFIAHRESSQFSRRYYREDILYEKKVIFILISCFAETSICLNCNITSLILFEWGGKWKEIGSEENLQ